jgi:hypothetical protein
MARILFAWELGAGLGHCVKLAPIAAGLIARGHTVFFAARDVVTARRVGGELPIQYLPAPYLGHQPVGPRRETYSLSQVIQHAGFDNDDQLTALVASWRNLISLVQPAAILCEHAPTALLASRWADMQRFVIGTGFSLPPDVAPLPNLRPRSNLTVATLRSHELRLLDRVNRLLNADGLGPLERLSQLYADVEARFLMAFAELDHHPARAGDVYRGLWSLDGGMPPQWPEGDGPKVFAYLKHGAVPWNAEQTLSQLSELGARTIAYVSGTRAILANSANPTLQISRGPLDIAAIGRECDVAILHGTAGTTTQLLLAGVPLVLAPLYFEQAIMSLRVAQLGAGLIVDARRPRSMQHAIETLLSSASHRAAARSFSEKYMDYDATAEQAAIVNRILQGLG